MNTRQGRLHPLILLGLFAFAPAFTSAAVPAFPGAQGAGAESVGGRGGRVIEVTNLNDSGPGSFRDAVSQTGPRTVVFRIGGTIALQSAVSIRKPYLTIAGQTGTKVNFIGNYFKKGPDTGSRYEVLVSQAGAGVKEQLPQMVYVRDNLGPHRTSSAQAEWAIVGMYPAVGVAPTSYQKSSPWPSSGFPITVSPAQANVDNVLNNVGATLPARDAVDTRLVAEYRAGTGSLGGDNKWPVLAAGTPPADTDHDGMPDQWETSKGLQPHNAADRNAIAGSGYTNLEVYLAGAGSGTTPPPPPPPSPRPRHLRLPPLSPTSSSPRSSMQKGSSRAR